MNHNPDGSYDIHGLDPIAAKVLGSISRGIPQAQYSTHDQLIVICELARRLKLYDGMDIIQGIIDNPPLRLRD